MLYINEKENNMEYSLDLPDEIFGEETFIGNKIKVDSPLEICVIKDFTTRDFD